MKRSDTESAKHLDLGCGLLPRNPYNAPDCHGIDIREIDDKLSQVNFKYVRANLTIDKIPYPDNFFDSISAFDFLEHVPRQLMLSNGELSNPFIELMNEIYRVLKNNSYLLIVVNDDEDIIKSSEFIESEIVDLVEKKLINKTFYNYLKISRLLKPLFKIIECEHIENNWHIIARKIW